MVLNLQIFQLLFQKLRFKPLLGKIRLWERLHQSLNAIYHWQLAVRLCKVYPTSQQVLLLFDIVLLELKQSRLISWLLKQISNFSFKPFYVLFVLALLFCAGSQQTLQSLNFTCLGLEAAWHLDHLVSQIVVLFLKPNNFTIRFIYLFHVSCDHDLFLRLER